MEPSENQHSLNEYGVAGGKKKEVCQPSPENKKPPDLSFKLKKAGDVPKSTEILRNDHLPIDILLLTSVESCDFLSCFSLLDQPFKCYKKEIGVVYFGRVGDVSDQEKLKVALINCSKGAAAPGGSLTVVLNAVHVLQPKAVFLVGTCISLGLEKARMGDVVISSKLTTAEGFKTPGSPLLGNLVRDAPYGWIAPLKNPDECEIKVHCNGDILSQSLREKCQNVNICEQYPTAVAIETEGEGVYAAAYDSNVEWVIVKGVASYFHQSQSATSEWMSFASTMAASVVAKILNHPAVFREWPHYNQGVEHTSLDRAYSSLRSGDLESAISAQATVQHREADRGTLDQGASLMTSNRLASTMASQPRIKENHGKRPLHPSVTTTLERKRQNTDIPERVDYATLDQGYSSLRSGHLESAVGAQAMIQRRGVDRGTSDQGASLLTSNRLSSTIGSHTRIRENHGKRPLHPLKTTVQERQRQIKNIAARVDHGTSDQGASLLTSNGLASAMGSQFRRKENHGKRPVHSLETATPEKQRQNPDFTETDIDISKVVELLKREYNRRADFSPLLWSKGMKLQLKEVYTSVRVVSRRKAGSWEIDVDHIFGSSEEDNDPLVLVEGSPGIGKTTFCLKLAHDWANGAMPRTFPSFKLVFLLKCRDMEGDIVKDVVEEIFEQLLPEDLKEKTKEALVNFLEDLDNQKQILILLDGLDELPEKSEHRVNKVLGRKKLSFCYLLATTRQEKGIDTRKQFEFDICLAIEGFSEENSFEYIRKHFTNIGTEHSSKGERLIEEIKQNHLLRDLQSNPLNLLLLCVVYEDHEGSLPSSFTDLYQTIVRCLLRRYCAREELKASEKDGDLDKQFEITILAIGELAWKCLLNDHLSFYEDELEEVERNNENIVARRLGLVYKEESLKRLKPRHAYSFLHRTFQEYLAASYIAHKFRGSEFQVLKQMLFPEIARRKFKQVFVFVCGILREEANILFEHIGNMLQKQWDWLKCDMSTAHFFVDSWKETGNAERMAKTLCSFLRFPRSLHLWNEEQCNALCYVLKKCSEFSEVVTFAEVHVAEDVEFKSTYYELESTRYVSSLLELPYVKSVIIYGELRLIDYKALVKRLDKTLVEKLTFALCADIGEGVSKFPDFGFSSVRVRICGSLGSSLLQDVENLLLHKRLSSLSITVCGDVQESLVEGLARGLAGESAVKFFDLCINGNLSFHGAYLLEKGILRNRSLRNVKVSVNGEPPENWQVVAKNLCAQFAEKAIVSAIYPNTFSKVKDTQVTHLNRFLSKTDLEQQTVTLNVWGELSGDGCKAVYEVLLHSPVSPLTVNIHAQLTDEILRCTASCVEEQEKLSSITINAWFEMTEKETKLIKELGLDKNASFLLNVNGTSAPLKESIIDSKVISSDERQSGFAFFEKATKGPSKSTERSPHKSLRLTFSYDGDMSSEWEHDLGEGLAGNSSLKSLTLQIYNFGDTRKDWGRGLGEGLLRNTSLKSLELEFDNYGDTSKEWRRGLDEGLVQNTSLESLIMKVDNLSLESLIMEMNNPSLISLGTIYNYRGRGLCEGLARNTSLKSLTLQIHSHGDKSNEWGRGLGEGLARNTSLKSLTLQIHSHGDKSNEWGRGLGEGLATNNSLKSLTLQIAGYGDTSKEWGRGLFEGLARNTSLESLTIKINIYGDVSNEWEHGLGEGLARNSSLESLTVKINNYGNVSNEWEHGLGEGLTRNSSLKSLTLQIHSHGDKSNQWGRGLGQGLARNSSLKSLALQIDDCGNTSKEWGRGLGKGLARNTSLESLTMIISNHGDVSNEWKHGLGEGLARNTSLKSLALQIDDYGDTSKEWGRGLDEGLARNTSLESLTIKINKGGHTNYEWEQGLGEGLAGNTSLKSLTLEIYTYGSKEWGRGLGEGLARNTSLESLTIKINNDSDTSDEWEHNYGDVSNEWEHGLGEGLGGNCSLKSLTLQINNYGDTSKESGRGLGEGLLKNTSLNSLTLTINNYSYMSDEWGVRFAEGLARNTSLKSVTLTMNNYFYMSSVWGLGVFEGSVRNTSLKSITLAINNYGDMKGEWGHGLVEGLARNMSLKSLTLAINNYGDMNGEWEHGLVEGLARNTSLNSLTLKISNYCYMSHVWGLGLAEGLARNTSLNSLTLAANNYGDMSEWGCAFREGLTKSKSLTECDLIVNICGTC